MKHLLAILAVAALGLTGCDTNAPEPEDSVTTPAAGDTPAATDTGATATPAP